MSFSERRMILARRTMFWAAVFGLFVATYLLITYVSGGPIVCGITHGCDVVRASKWATSFGMPRPLLGVVFYAAFILLLVFRTMVPRFHARLLYHVSMALVGIGFLESAFLTFVQWLDIKAFCIWCLLSASAATVMFVASWWDSQHPLEDALSLRELKIQFWSFAAAVVLGGVCIALLVGPRTDGERPRIEAPATDPAEEARVRALLYPEGMTFEGPTSSRVTLVEFIDYQCPGCASAHPELQNVRERFKGQIRFGVRMFPLTIHKDAGAAALAAVCADRQGMLFAMGDLLIANQKALGVADLLRYAARLRLDTDAFRKCLADQSSQDRVLQDVQDGHALGVSQTPTFFLNDAMIDGLPSADQLGTLIEERLAGSSEIR